MSNIVVAVGVILRDDKVFISRRADDRHQGGKWEFPGGKQEPEETIEQALARELAEECNIEVLATEYLLSIAHDYPDKSVTLEVYLVTDFTGEARQLEQQLARWVSISELAEYNFPAANKVIIEALQDRYLDQ